MRREPNKNLAPFTNSAPLVPGRRGADPIRWSLERDKQQLNDEILELAKVLRRFSEEMIETLLYLKNPHKPEERTRRLASQILGALKRESATLTSMFDLCELHPALLAIFNAKQTTETEIPKEIAPSMLALEAYAAPDQPKEACLRYALTDREFEILTLLLADEKPRAVAERLGIAPTTVYATLDRIKTKAREIAAKKGDPPSCTT